MVFPFFFWGNPSGHDFEFHVNSWMEVVSHWQHGIIYPAWAGLAHYGYGEARFIFYPPISWTVGAILGATLPWRIVPGVYIWIALTLSGCSMFSLARTWLSRRDALFAACIYSANPYYLVIIYWRSAFAELLAGALLPLLLLFVLRPSDDRGRTVITLAIIVATAWLTNIPAAVMVTYSLALLLAIQAVERQSVRIAAKRAIAFPLGAALAAFYLVPAIYEQKWINVAQALGPGLRPTDNFLFTGIADIEHNRFNYLISLVALSQVAVLAIAIVRSRKRRPSNLPWLYLGSWGLVSALLLLPFTAAVWTYFPELKFIQLPWRWLLCLNVPFALLVTISWRHWTARILVCVALLAVLVFVWHRIQPPWWDNAADLAEMLDDQQIGRGYEGTDEYVPAGADPYETSQTAPFVMGENGNQVQVNIQRWDAESKLFTAQANHPAKLSLRLFNYPAWRVKINGRITPTQTRDVTGQMVIPIEPGVSSVAVMFTRTWDRVIGILISLLTALLGAIFALRQRGRRHLPAGT